jgi:hypothetical protein
MPRKDPPRMKAKTRYLAAESLLKDGLFDLLQGLSFLKNSRVVPMGQKWLQNTRPRIGVAATTIKAGKKAQSKTRPLMKVEKTRTGSMRR